MRYKIQDTRYKIQETRYKIQEWLPCHQVLAIERMQI